MAAESDSTHASDSRAAHAGVWPRLAWVFAATLIAAAVVVAFLQFRIPGHGFTYVFDFGETLGLPRLAEIDASATYIHPGVPGYDGQMYAQLALRPLAQDPELTRVIDNPPYRARRAFMGWLAWLLGLGNPWWVLNVQACLNLVFWILLSWLLVRWFRPSGGVDSLVRWAGVLLSSGMLSSLRHALTDGPALFLVALAVACVEAGRPFLAAGVGAAAGLTRETAVLWCAALLPQRWRDGRGWLRAAVESAIVVLPLGLWIWHLRGIASGSTYDNSGVANFTWPFAGFLERWRDLIAVIVERGWQKTVGAALLAHLALTVNVVWIVARPRWADRWWRIGAAHVALLAVLNTQVWEGYPGAAARVLLPLLLAFNILAPRGRRWLPLILAGNLSVFSGMLEMSGPPQPIWSVRGADTISGGAGHRSVITVDTVKGFHGLEGRGANTWRWTTGDAVVKLKNSLENSVQVRVRLEMRAVDERAVTIRARDVVVWSGVVDRTHREVESDVFTLGPGVTDVLIESGSAVTSPGGEARSIALRVFALDVLVVGTGEVP